MMFQWQDFSALENWGDHLAENLMFMALLAAGLYLKKNNE